MFRNIYINQGQSFYKEFQVTDASGLAIDISGLTITGRLQHNPESVVYVDFTTTLTDPVNGKYSIALTPTQTDILSKPTYMYMTQGDTGTVKTRLHEGSGIISFGILHP